MADPCETRAAVEERDPVRERLAELSAAWGEVYGQGEATLADRHQGRDARSAACRQTRRATTRARLKAAIMEAAGEGGAPNARKLGWFLAKHEGRIEDGRHFRPRRGAPGRGAVARRNCRQGRGFCGFCGFCQPRRASNCQDPLSDTYMEWGEKNPRKHAKPAGWRAPA